MAQNKFTSEWLENLEKTTGLKVKHTFSTDQEQPKPKPKRNGKYNAVKVPDEETGAMIDSKIEAAHVSIFRLELKQGKIQCYSRQVEFYLNAIGSKYIADHAWFDFDGNYHVADSKGFQTPEFKLKWKAVQIQYPWIKFHLLMQKKFKGTETLV